MFDAPADAAEQLYDADGWVDHPLTSRSRFSRLYVCRCSVLGTSVFRELIDPDPDPTDAALPPWRCEGHPVAALPLDVDGVTIAADTDFDALVSRVFAGWMPPASAEHDFYEAWVARLYQRLAGLDAADRVSHAVAHAMESGDDVSVGSALVFFGRYPEAAGADAVLDLADRSSGRRVWPVRVAARKAGRRLSDTLVSWLEAAPLPLSGRDVRARDALRALLLDSEAEVSTLNIVPATRSDGEWLARNLAAVAGAHPELWSSVLEGLAARDTALASIAGIALVRGGTVDPDALRSWLQDRGRLAWVTVVQQALNP